MDDQTANAPLVLLATDLDGRNLYGSKLSSQETARLSAWFHLAGLNVGHIFLTHCQMESAVKSWTGCESLLTKLACFCMDSHPEAGNFAFIHPAQKVKQKWHGMQRDQEVRQDSAEHAKPMGRPLPNMLHNPCEASHSDVSPLSVVWRTFRTNP